VADKISAAATARAARALARRIKAHPAYTAALGNLLGILGPDDGIDLWGDTQTPYLDTRPLKVAGKPEIREYKAMFVVGDQEIGIFSHELVVNCAP
jgi:hypothetical protein